MSHPDEHPANAGDPRTLLGPDPARPTSDGDPAGSEPPLYVDLDGTLIPGDMLYESVALLARERPLDLARLPGWLLGGRANLKRRIAERVEIDPETLPYRSDVIEYLQAERARGRKIVLVTAADGTFARAVADHLGLFDRVVASDGRINVKGRGKLAAIRDQLGPGPFDYIGDSHADLAVWAEARRILAVAPSAGLLRGIGRIASPYRVFEGPGTRVKARALVRMLRPHQWAKNLLLFVPVFTSHTLDPADWLAALLGFIAFCLMASSVYILNDLVDLQADRHHATKRRRPLAAGLVPIPVGAAVAAVILAIAAAITATLPARFGVVMLIYVLLTTGYSFVLKKKLLVDVFCLAGLYTLRIQAGGAATGIITSPWLNAFSVFFFLSLAYLKRFTELSEKAQGPPDERIRGRGYMPIDLDLIRVSGIVSGFLSVLVFSLYINAPEVSELYRSPERLWLACPILLYFISRVFFLAQRGQMPDDPVVFAIKDRHSILAGLLVLLVVLMAI